MLRRKYRVAFSWFGGKTRHLHWLLPLINSTPHTSYVEPFGGSAAVLLNKQPSPVEVYNDIYGEVVNFFRVLRTSGPELVELLQLTPYSREEFRLACRGEEMTEIEAARRFFVKARQIRNGLVSHAREGRWSYTKKDVRNRIALNVSQWLTAINDLPDIVNRLRSVQLENLDGVEVIGRYDTENTLHFVDPPYLMEVRTGGVGYGHEFGEDDHRRLLKVLSGAKGKVILSGYPNELYGTLGWRCYRRKERYANSTLQNGQKKLRCEAIWTNYNCDDLVYASKGWHENNP
jgi:DNA adenine methylase